MYIAWVRYTLSEQILRWFGCKWGMLGMVDVNIITNTYLWFPENVLVAIGIIHCWCLAIRLPIAASWALRVRPVAGLYVTIVHLLVCLKQFWLNDQMSRQMVVILARLYWTVRSLSCIVFGYWMRTAMAVHTYPNSSGFQIHNGAVSWLRCGSNVQSCHLSAGDRLLL